jgi:hypothetical protein
MSMQMEKGTLDFKTPGFQTQHLYYKIGNNRNQLEKIFTEDKDKKAIGDTVDEAVEAKVEEVPEAPKSD